MVIERFSDFFLGERGGSFVWCVRDWGFFNGDVGGLDMVGLFLLWWGWGGGLKGNGEMLEGRDRNGIIGRGRVRICGG